MKRRYLLFLLAGAVTICSMSACGLGKSKDNKEDQVVVDVEESQKDDSEKEKKEKEEKAEETPAPTEAPKTTDFTSADGMISLKTPDLSWANKEDANGVIFFESPDNGSLRIKHVSGEAMATASDMVPNTVDTVDAEERAAGLETGTDYEVRDFSAQELADGAKVITYQVHYVNIEKSGGVVDKLFKYVGNNSEYFDIEASLLKDDGTLMSQVKEMIQGIQILGDSTLKGDLGSSAPAAEAPAPAASAAGSRDSVETDYTEEQLNDVNQTRVIYMDDEVGTPFVIQNVNGVWTDKAGNTYTFSETEESTVHDQDGNYYYYDGLPGSYRYMSKDQ